MNFLKGDNMCDHLLYNKNVPIREITNYGELQQPVAIWLANGTLKRLKIFAQ